MNSVYTHPIFFSTSLQILKNFLFRNQKILDYLFIDGGTLIGLERYGNYGIMPWDDDIDLGIIAKNDIILELINNCLIHNLSIVVHILKDFTKSFNYSDSNFRTVHVELTLSNNMKNISFDDRNNISIEELKENINYMAFFNVSINEKTYIDILKKYKIYDSINLEYYDKINKKHLVVPWIDIFPYELDDNNYLKYNRNFGANSKQKELENIGTPFLGFKLIKFHDIDINILINSKEHLDNSYDEDILKTIKIYGSHHNPLVDQITVDNTDDVKEYVKNYNNQIKKYNFTLI